MKKLAFIVGLWLIAFVQVAAQMSYYPTNTNAMRANLCPLDRSEGSGIEEVVERIEQVLDFDQDYVYYKIYNQNNAYAAYWNGQRALVFDIEFLEQLNQKTKWCAIYIIAHEVGHQYYDHPMKYRRSNHKIELEADYFAAYVLAKLGASLQSTEAAMWQIGTQFDTETHPSRNRRIASIRKGWYAGKNN